jgi:undecaprenyl-diphosphatase
MPLRVLLLLLALWNAVGEADRAGLREIQSLRTPALESAMRAATGLGKREIVLGALLGIAILDPTGGVTTAREAVLALLATNGVVEAIKYGVNRVRPDGDRTRSNSSFPSGHTASAVALAIVLSRRWRRLRLAFGLLALTVAFSRVYLNRHYPSDVICAAIIGFATTHIVLAAFDWWRGPRKPRDRRPSTGAMVQA